MVKVEIIESNCHDDNKQNLQKSSDCKKKACNNALVIENANWKCECSGSRKETPVNVITKKTEESFFPL